MLLVLVDQLFPGPEFPGGQIAQLCPQNEVAELVAEQELDYLVFTAA